MKAPDNRSCTMTFDPNTATVTAAISCRLASPLLTGVRYADRSLSTSKNGETLPLENGLLYRAAIEGDGCVLTELRQDGEAMTIRQHASCPTLGERGGIAGSYFTIELPDEFAVLVPAWNGVRLTKDTPLFWDGWTTRVEIGLLDLQLPMLLLEGKDGGFLLYAEDRGNQFKAFDIRHEDSLFRIQVETIPQAPFAEIRDFSAVTWRILPYRGGWENGAERYREVLKELYPLEEADARRPAWAKDITLFFLTDIGDRKELEALAARTDPTKVLLHVPGWRKELYDVNWPDLTPRPGFAEDVAFAHKLGFRVQLHCNMNGFQQELPEFAEHAACQSRDKFTGELAYADFSDAVRHYKFAQMNPASAKWRKHLIDRIVAAVKETGADAVHLDESLFARNDRNGLIDGLTSQQGNVLLHRELLDALPEGIALGGESITECNAQYATFLQSHVYAVGEPVYIPNQVEQIVPLTCAVLRDYLRPYQWPGYPVSAKEHAFLLWHLTGQATGLLPTIMRESAHAIGTVYPPCLKAVVDQANFLRDTGAKPLFAHLTGLTLMRWQLRNGGIAAFVRTAEGYAFLPDETIPDRALYRIRLDEDNILSIL